MLNLIIFIFISFVSFMYYDYIIILKFSILLITIAQYIIQIYLYQVSDMVYFLNLDIITQANIFKLILYTILNFIIHFIQSYNHLMTLYVLIFHFFVVSIHIYLFQYHKQILFSLTIIFILSSIIYLLFILFYNLDDLITILFYHKLSCIINIYLI